MTLQLEFQGIDKFNRPVFLNVGMIDMMSGDGKEYFSSSCELFGFNASEDEVLSVITRDDITYHGRRFDSEPHGYELDESVEIEFV